MSRPAGRIPSLDGLRAVSILLVLQGHLRGTEGYPNMPAVRAMGDMANFGVRVFFIISGYLITSLLIKEHAKTGTISLKNFFIRRAFRIFPAFYLYIAVVWLLGSMGWFSLGSDELVYAATYTMNFVDERSWQLGHLWSLAVEEQFYLLWPALVLALGLFRGLVGAALVVIATPLIRIGWFYLLPEHRGLIGVAFPTVWDTIAAGCVLALARDRLNGIALYAAILRSRFFLLLPLSALIVNAILPKLTLLHWLVGETYINVALAMTIEWAIQNPHTRTGRFLNFKPVVFVGTLSYSIYLWQQVFLDRNSEAWYCAFPQNIGLALVLALLSYLLVEKPCLNLRQRLALGS